MKRDTITLSFTCYTVRGVSDLTLWGGGNVLIVMNPFDVDKIEEVQNNINDAGFGVERINGAICDIYKNYCGHLKYVKTIEVGQVSEETRKYYQEWAG